MKKETRAILGSVVLLLIWIGTMSFVSELPAKQDGNAELNVGKGAKENRIIAFPGAEGHGRFTTGGRGGKVYHVTSLEDDGSKGTLRWALKQDGPKTIVFDVAGTIHLTSELRTGKDDLTLAGQTSPGGICLADYGFSINSNNVIIRFLRFRPGEASGKEPDGLGGSDKKDIIVDHCSISWSVDECLSIYGMENSTVQWCIASEALRKATHVKGAHGYGGNWGGKNASYHHNLIAHCESRVPRLGPRPTTLALTECVDIRNNVFYNWAGNGCYGGENQHVNIVNNYYKPGPATEKAHKIVQYRIAKVGIYPRSYVYVRDEAKKNLAFQPYLQKWGTFYIDGNVMEGNSKVTADNWTDGVYAQQKNDDKIDFLWTEEAKASIRLKEPLDFGDVSRHSAERAYKQVLKYAGCSNYRDAVDQRIISDTQNKEATYTGEGNAPGFINSPMDTGESPWPELKIEGLTAPVDSDGDGMPDEWEIKNGLNPRNPEDGNENSKDFGSWRYTNLEAYLNSLVKDIVEKQNGGIVTTRKYEGEEVFEWVEVMPQFPGGAAELIKFLRLPMSGDAMNGNGAIGRVILQFVIEKDGTVTNSRVARGVDPYLDKAALKLLENMPLWTPGMQDANKVRVLMTVPVNYKYESEDSMKNIAVRIVNKYG